MFLKRLPNNTAFQTLSVLVILIFIIGLFIYNAASKTECHAELQWTSPLQDMQVDNSFGSISNYKVLVDSEKGTATFLAEKPGSFNYITYESWSLDYNNGEAATVEYYEGHLYKYYLTGKVEMTSQLCPINVFYTYKFVLHVPQEQVLFR